MLQAALVSASNTTPSRPQNRSPLRVPCRILVQESTCNVQPETQDLSKHLLPPGLAAGTLLPGVTDIALPIRTAFLGNELKRLQSHGVPRSSSRIRGKRPRFDTKEH